MPVIEALDLCAAVLWLTRPFADANHPNPFAGANHPNPFAEANHPSLSAMDSHPFAELAVDAFSVAHLAGTVGAALGLESDHGEVWRRRVRGAEGCQ